MSPQAELDNAVSLACHKLRTPLTAAMGFIQLALRDARRAEDAGQNRNLEQVDQQLRRMAAIIDQLSESAER